MRPLTNQAVPIYPGLVAKLSSPRGLQGFKGGAHPQFRGSYPGYPGGCDCGPAGGCRCGGVSLSVYDPGRGVFAKTLGQNVSLDTLIGNAFNWLGGVTQSQLPASAAVPPQYGSAGAIGTQLMQWAPYIIGGYLVYKLIK